MGPGADRTFARTPLIGRDAHLAIVMGLFKQAESGRGSVALMTGPGGVGKSRLVAEIANRAKSMGALVLRSQSSTFDAGIPYTLLSRLIDDLPEDVSPEIRDLVARIRSQISNVEPMVPGRRNATAFDTDRLLRLLTVETPLVIVADDLHLVDDDSLALLTRLLRTINQTPTLLLGTARRHGTHVSPSLPELIDFLERSNWGEVVDLVDLDRLETRSVIAELLGVSPDNNLTSLVFESSHGNPFFTTEVVRTLIRSGRIHTSTSRAHLGAGERLPQSHTSLIHRFFEVGSVDTQVARVLSTFGRIEIDRIGAISVVSGIDELLVGKCVDRLVAAGLLWCDERDGYKFTHSLLREALYDDIGPVEQRRLHRSIASHLMRLSEGGVEVDIVDLATHFAASAERGDTKAREVLTEAGQSVAAVAPLVAASWFEQAANLAEEGTVEWAEILAERAHCLFRASRPLETVKVAKSALSVLGAGRLRERTICDVVNSLYISGDLHGAIEFIERVGQDSTLPHSVKAQYAHFRTQLGTSTTVRCDHFLEFEPSTGTLETVMLAHDMLHSSTVGRLDIIAKGIERIDQLRPIVGKATRFAMDSFLAMSLVTIEDFAATKAVIDRNEHSSELGSNLSLSALFETTVCTLQFFSGEWDECIRYSDDVLWQMESNGIRIMEAFLRSSTCLIQVERGDLRSAREIARTLFTPAHGMKATVDSAVARVDRAIGHPERGIERLETLLNEKQRLGMEVSAHLILGELALCHQAAGSQRNAERIVDRLCEEWAGSQYGYVKCRANLVYGSVQGDVESLNLAAQIAEKEGFKFEHGKSRLMLAEHGIDARANFEIARDVFESLGAVPWRQQTLAGLRRIGVSSPRSGKRSGEELSEVEMRIVELVAQGMTNKAIASALHYSIKTVEVYLTRIYGKTATTSRLDLARAVDRGLVILS